VEPNNETERNGKKRTFKASHNEHGVMKSCLASPANVILPCLVGHIVVQYVGEDSMQPKVETS
jgi:hypothetical protein